MDWIFDSFDARATAWIVERLRSADAHAMGSRTFADMKAHWPTSTEAYAEPMNAIPKTECQTTGTGRTSVVLSSRHPAPHAAKPSKVFRGPLDGAAAHWVLEC